LREQLTSKERRLLVNPNLKISVNRQCQLLGVERSGLYYKPRPKVDDTVMMNRIYDIWYKSPTFGYRRVTKVLRREGTLVNRKKIGRLMKAMGLHAIYPKPKTSIKNGNHKIYKYLLAGLDINHVNQAWQVDITYIRTRKGFVYLAALIDVYSRYIVGWALSNTIDTTLCLDALNSALKQGKAGIINSDQGSQFTSEKWVTTLQSQEIDISMTGKGRCLDNVYIERFWRSIKHEKIKLSEFDNIHELEKLIADYIQHYNHERPHQALGEYVPAEVFNGARTLS
jgi:putative transposase